jgi:iron complex outermembrane receptor protein
MQPSARLQWLIGEGQTAWAAISRAVRVPSWLEQDLTIFTGVIPPGTIPMIPVPVKVEVQPSPSFDSEELVAYELGFRTQCAPNLSFDLAAFYNDYDKLSTLTILPPVFGSPPPHLILPIATTNLTEGEAYGFELVATWRATEALDLSAAYSFLEINLHGPPSSQAINAEIGEGQSPQQQFNTRIRWNATDNFALDSTLYFVDELPAFAIDSYWRLDARVGWRLTNDVEIEVVGQDVFDQTGSDSSAAEIGRSIFGRLTWRP